MKTEDRNVHEGHRERVRKRFLEHGLDAFADHEALELLLFYCVPRRDTNERAHKLIDDFGGLTHLFDASPEALAGHGLSEKEAALIALVPLLAKRCSAARGRKRLTINDADEAGEYARTLFAGAAEQLYAVCMDSGSRVIAAEMLADGAASCVNASPRQVVECALKRRAARVILAHNHPGGSLQPGDDDLRFTVAAARALSAVDIELTDHIIITENDYYSFMAKGIMSTIVSDL